MLGCLSTLFMDKNLIMHKRDNCEKGILFYFWIVSSSDTHCIGMDGLGGTHGIIIAQSRCLGEKTVLDVDTLSN